MKMMVKVVGLIATLLLLTGVSFADDCACYEFTETILDDIGPVMRVCPPVFKICFDGDNEGTISGLCNPLCLGSEVEPLYMFFDAMNQEALTYHTNLWTCVAYLKFHGDNQHIVNGILFEEFRITFKGHKTDMEKCNFSPSPP